MIPPGAVNRKRVMDRVIVTTNSRDAASDAPLQQRSLRPT
jgi:hypothetical protein